ncbi:MAG: serine/threonine-protein kinase, partial [Myxococcota bacterium]
MGGGEGTSEEVQAAERTLRETWARLGVDPDARTEVPTGATVEPPPASVRLNREALTLDRKIGEGGMGLVFTGVQPGLGRDVAIKLCRRHDAAHEALLVEEAQVTGGLEHPNILPVYAIAEAKEGRAAIVMKRVRGEPWSEILAAYDGERNDDAYLRRHLGILRQVSLAVAFAHERGVLHRDIKPENVLVGSYGEVYLVDWGIAVGLSEAAVRPASSVRAIEGTPAYMAPEMAAGDGASLGVHSDVYLLGAALYEVLEGEPPHVAPTIQGVLISAFHSRPAEHGAHLPMLAALANRARASDPADRFPTAAAFAQALERYEATRAAQVLSARGEEKAAVLRERIAGGAPRRDIEAAFYEARFAFEQASRELGENEAVLAGAERTLESMVRFVLIEG